MSEETNENDSSLRDKPSTCKCTCDECGWAHAMAREAALQAAAEAGDAVRLAALLHCRACWQPRMLYKPLQAIASAEAARAFAAAVPDFFWGSNGEATQALLHASTRGQVKVVRALLGAGVDANSTLDWWKTKPLAFALTGRHTDCVKVLLEHGADIGHRERGGLTPLHLAAVSGEAECVNALLRKGADPQAVDEKGHVPLHYAAAHGLASCVHALLQGGADPNVGDPALLSPLHYAARAYRSLPCPFRYLGRHNDVEGDYEACVQHLIEFGANVNAVSMDNNTPLLMAVLSGQPIIVETLINYGADAHHRNDAGEIALHYAAAGNSPECVAVLARAGACVNALNAAGDSPLMAAVKEGALAATVEILGLRGADSEGDVGGVGHRDAEGYTALHCAAAQALSDVAQVLLHAGADINAHTFVGGITPLHLAATASSTECLSTLLDWGADVNVRTEDGKTPLHFAATCWETLCLKELLERGADLQARDNIGNSALDVAVEVGVPNIVNFLQEQRLALTRSTDD